MAKQRLTVRGLAERTGLELDEVLLSLWDVGITEVNDPADVVPSSKVRAAELAFELPGRGDFRRVAYWANQAGITEDELRKLLRDAGIPVSANARNLPKGAVRRVRRIVLAETGGRGSSVRFEPRPEPRLTIPPLRWEVIGAERDIQFLTLSEVVHIHNCLVEDFASHHDPIAPAGVADATLLGSALFRAETAFGDDRKYPTIEMAGAALLHSLILDHAFHNGNKRTALVATLVFLDRNGLILTATEDEVFKFVVQVAQHRIVDRSADRLADREALAMAAWISSNSRAIQKGERLLKFIAFRRILVGFGCKFQHPKGVGNRVNIGRVIPASRFFGLSRGVKTQIFYGDDGRDVDKNTIIKVRHDLELDEAHGVDSSVFYGEAAPIDDFVMRYRRTLTRLARV